MKLLNKMNNSVLRVLVFLQVSVVSAFADNDFASAAGVISDASEKGRGVLGNIMGWLFAVFLPLACILGGILLGYKQTKKQAEQDQDSMKIYLMMALYGIVGFFVFMIVAVILGKALLGKTDGILLMIQKFYQAAFSSAGLSS